MPKSRLAARILTGCLMLAGIALPAARRAGSASASGIGPVANGVLPGPFPLFPATNWWNLDITSWPLDPNSASFISFINNGGTCKLHPDFGGDVSPGSTEIYGMPYAVVDGTQAKKAVQFLYSDESDGVDHATDTSFPFYPIPDEAITQAHWIEGGWPGNQDYRSSNDRHLLIVDRDNKYLYELYNVFYDGTNWLGGSGAFFDMNTNNRRPDGWTSADAAGLAILPGLVRYDEVYGPNEIAHAFRFTVRATNGYVYPASHRAGSTTGAPPMGTRLRLKASKDISSFPADAQKIFRAMKKYGLILADNGSDMYITGTYDNRWNNSVLNPAFAGLTASDFEVIQLGYNPPAATATPSPVTSPAGTATPTATRTPTNTPAPASLFTVAPCRAADTRNPVGASGGPALSANTVRSFPVAGVCGIPSSATAVAIILAVVAPSDSGDLLVYPAGAAAPLASSINFRPGIVRANNAVVPLGAGGQLSVRCDMASPSGSTAFFFDVYGYFQ